MEKPEAYEKDLLQEIFDQWTETEKLILSNVYDTLINAASNLYGENSAFTVKMLAETVNHYYQNRGVGSSEEKYLLNVMDMFKVIRLLFGDKEIQKDATYRDLFNYYSKLSAPPQSSTPPKRLKGQRPKIDQPRPRLLSPEPEQHQAESSRMETFQQRLERLQKKLLDFEGLTRRLQDNKNGQLQYENFMATLGDGPAKTGMVKALSELKEQYNEILQALRDAIPNPRWEPDFSQSTWALNIIRPVRDEIALIQEQMAEANLRQPLVTALDGNNMAEVAHLWKEIVAQESLNTTPKKLLWQGKFKRLLELEAQHNVLYAQIDAITSEMTKIEQQTEQMAENSGLSTSDLIKEVKKYVEPFFPPGVVVVPSPSSGQSNLEELLKENKQLKLRLLKRDLPRDLPPEEIAEQISRLKLEKTQVEASIANINRRITENEEANKKRKKFYSRDDFEGTEDNKRRLQEQFNKQAARESEASLQEAHLLREGHDEQTSKLRGIQGNIRTLEKYKRAWDAFLAEGGDATPYTVSRVQRTLRNFVKESLTYILDKVPSQFAVVFTSQPKYANQLADVLFEHLRGQLLSVDTKWPEDPTVEMLDENLNKPNSKSAKVFEKIFGTKQTKGEASPKESRLNFLRKLKQLWNEAFGKRESPEAERSSKVPREMEQAIQ
jgi:hypothetical protein